MIPNEYEGYAMLALYFEGRLCQGRQLTTFLISAPSGVFYPIGRHLWAIYTDMHGFATRGAELENGQLCVPSKHLHLSQF